MLLSPIEGNNLEWGAGVNEVRLPRRKPCLGRDWPVEIPLPRGGSRKLVALAAEVAPAAALTRRSVVWPRPSRLGARSPSFAIAPESGFRRVCEMAALRASDLAAAAPSLQPAPVECLVVASAELEAAGAPLSLPQFAVTASEDLDRLREAAALRASNLAGAAPSLQPVPVECLAIASAALEAAAAA